MISYTIKRNALKEPLTAAIHHHTKVYRSERDKLESSKSQPMGITMYVADLRRQINTLKTILSTVHATSQVDGRTTPRVDSYTLSQELYDLIFEI